MTNHRAENEKFTDGRTDGPTKRCLVATFVHKFGCLFPVWLLGFVWLRLYVQTHKTVSCGYFCPYIWVSFFLCGYRFCVAANKQNSHKSTNCTKIATEVVFCKNDSPYMGTWTQMIITCVFFCFSPYMDTWTHTSVHNVCVCFFPKKLNTYGM